MFDVIVVGGGAAGMMAAYSAAKHRKDNGLESRVCLLEQNEKLGKKIYITGKGRCNVTNAAEMEDLMNAIVTNRNFLYSSLYGFTNEDMISLLENYGCATKVERGNRVFPVSDHASDVTDALKKALSNMGVEIRLHSQVSSLLLQPIESVEDEKTSVQSKTPVTDVGIDSNPRSIVKEYKSKKNKKKKPEVLYECLGVRMKSGELLKANHTIIATGGCSYSTTGSTGDGYRFAEQGSHTIIAPRPSLVPFVTKEQYPKELQGLALKNVTLTMKYKKKVFFEEHGELLFTHFGVSGPLVLSASSYFPKKANWEHTQEVEGLIDLKPALSEKQLDDRVLRDFAEVQNKVLKNALDHLLPKKMIPVVIMLAGLTGEEKVHSITKEQRAELVHILKALPFTVGSLRGFNEAIITSGGVDIKEVDPGTMESKLVKHLHFAGEVLDLDAVTGGYNLQIAWSTGYAAGTVTE